MKTDASKGLATIALIIVVVTILVLGAFIVFMLSSNEYVNVAKAYIVDLIHLRTP